MEALKRESWRRLPEPCRGAGCGGAPGWRRSGDDRYWECLMSEVDTSPRAARPRSCLESGGWLERTGTARDVAPFFSERTASMPALPKDRSDPAAAHARWPCSGAPSLCDSPLGSEELFADAWCHDWREPPGHLGTVCFARTPRREQVRLSGMAAVTKSWLPFQRRAVLYSVPCPPCSFGDSACQAPVNPVPTGSVPESYLGPTDGKATETQPSSREPQTGRFFHQASADIEQALSKENGASAESPWKEWERRPRIQSDECQRRGFAAALSSCPPRRAVSAPESSHVTAPPAGDANSHPKMRSGFSSITITSRRVPRTAAGAGVGPVSRLGGAGSSAPTVNHSCGSVAPRRKVTILKVTEYRQSCSPGDRVARASPSAFRHRCPEGEIGGACSQDTPDAAVPWPRGSAITPSQSEVATEPVPLLEEPLSVSLRGKGSKPRVHRSTLSLYLEGNSADGGPVEEETGRRWDRPRRPLSYAGMPGCTHPCLAEPAPRPESSCVIDCLSDIARSPNTPCLATGSRGCQTHHSPAEPGKPVREGDVYGGSSHRSDSASRCSALAKTPDHGTHETVLALNAASVIANIKLQRQLMSAMSNGASAKVSNDPPDSGNTFVEDAGSHVGTPQEDRAVRRAPGRAGTTGHTGLAPVWSKPRGDSQAETQKALTLQEALVLHRPDFISRSLGRLKELEERANERRVHQRSGLPSDSTQGNKRRRCTKPNRPSGLDNLLKPWERAVSGQETALKPHWNFNSLPEVRRKKEEEQKKKLSQANRLRAEIFKKKLLDQILKRKSD